MLKKHMRGSWRAVISLLVLALLIAGCGGEDDDQPAAAPVGDAPTVEANIPTLPALGSAPDLTTGGDSGTSASEDRKLPGCADPDADECPSPLPPQLDAIARAQGVQVAYYSRYWEEVTGAAAGDAALKIQPSEANKFALKGVFTVRFAESAEAVLTDLSEAEQSDWTAANLGEGTVATVLDEAADPPMATVSGVFPLDDGRALVFEMEATGQYSVDFHHDVYAAMLDTLRLVAE